MCSSSLNPFTTNNILVRGTAALATGGLSEVGRAGVRAMTPKDPPPLPGLPPPPAAMRTPEVPRRRNNSSTGPVAASANSTVLTGALGVDPSTQNVGRTLLGGA
jgi:hypothetical protein